MPLQRQVSRLGSSILFTAGCSMGLISTAASDLTIFCSMDNGSHRAQFVSRHSHHAVVCALARKIRSAKQKRSDRSRVFREAGICIDSLTNIDQVDADICALTGHHFLAGTFKTYVDAAEGFMVVPSSSQDCRKYGKCAKKLKVSGVFSCREFPASGAFYRPSVLHHFRRCHDGICCRGSLRNGPAG